MHKIVRPDLRKLSFPSSNFAKDYKGKEGITRQCLKYGEAASTITIVVDVGHLFKKFYRGFDTNILIWMPYDEDGDNELVLPVKFRFESGCSDEIAASIFSCIIKPCVLPAEFRHGRGKMATTSFLPKNLSTYEFYNSCFVAHPFGLGQLPPQLFFKNTLKPREGISEVMEASKVFQLGSYLSSICLHDWTRVTLSSNLFDSWWQEWHYHIFCGSIHPSCIALDKNFASDSEVVGFSNKHQLVNL